MKPCRHGLFSSGAWALLALLACASPRNETSTADAGGGDASAPGGTGGGAAGPPSATGGASGAGGTLAGTGGTVGTFSPGAGGTPSPGTGGTPSPSTLGSSGRVVDRWEAHIGGRTIDDIAVGASGVYVVGSWSGSELVAGSARAAVGALSDVFVTRHDHDGNLHWVRTSNRDGEDYATALATAPNGDVVLHARTWETTSAFAGVNLNDVTGGALYRLTSAGAVASSGRVAPPLQDAVFDAQGALLGAGGVVAPAGVLKLDAAYARTWFVGDDLPATALAISPQGDVYFCGALMRPWTVPGLGRTITPVGQREMVVGRLSAAGAVVWVSSVGSTLFTSCNEIALFASDVVMVQGHFDGTINLPGAEMRAARTPRDYFYAGFNQNDGQLVWARSFNQGNAHDLRLATAATGVYLLITVGSPLGLDGHQVTGTQLVRLARTGAVEAFWEANHLSQVTKLRAYMQHFYVIDGKTLRRLDLPAP